MNEFKDFSVKRKFLPMLQFNTIICEEVLKFDLRGESQKIDFCVLRGGSSMNDVLKSQDQQQQ